MTNQYLCSLILGCHEDPHIAADEFTYEGEDIRIWLNSGRDTSPMINM